MNADAQADRYRNLLRKPMSADGLEELVDACAWADRELRHKDKAIQLQTQSAIAGMDAAAKGRAAAIEECRRAKAESDPSLVDSERAANEELTNEAERLRAQYAALRMRFANLADRLREEARANVPQAYRARGLVDKYLRGDNEAGGLETAADYIDELLNRDSDE